MKNGLGKEQMTKTNITVMILKALRQLFIEILTDLTQDIHVFDALRCLLRFA